MEKSKELTPMMELIEMCKTLMSNNTKNPQVYQTAMLIKSRAQRELLLKEKQIIIDSFEDAFTVSEIDGIDYYNTKYKNYEI